MDLVGGFAVAGGGVKPGIRLVLPGIDTGGPAVWSVFVGAIGRDYEDSGK